MGRPGAGALPGEQARRTRAQSQEAPAQDKGHPASGQGRAETVVLVSEADELDETRGASELDLPTYSEHWGRKGRTTADWTPEEKQHNRRVYGVTYRERYGEPAGVCVTYCLTPGQRRRGIRCPSCFQGVEIRPMDGSEVEPGPTRAERFAAWVGGWAGSFCEALMYPFRVGRAHTEAMIKDILQEAMAAGLSAEVDGLTDILTVLEGIEGELRAIRNAAELAGERLCNWSWA